MELLMIIIGIVLIIGNILLLIYNIHKLKKIPKINDYISQQNQELEKNNQELKQNSQILEEQYQKLEKTNQELEDQHQRITENLDTIKKEFFNENQKYRDINSQVHVAQRELIDTQNHLNDIQNNILKTTETQKELSQKAFENYCETLEKQYKEQEEEYEQYTDAMQTAYSNLQLKLLKDAEDEKASIQGELETIREELAKIKATREAALAAQLKEKEIKADQDSYRLNISEAALKDIRLLKSIQPEITNAIVIDKIIWSNYYQPLAKVKFPRIIGKPTTCGIYKITSIISGSCYIGQSNDCCDRWKQHCKNALGVGSVTGENKLYKLMKEEGLNNFTFEILEECDKTLLDEKEKYYINLYNAYDYGLNGNRGNGKN